jgi:electron transfer flavoprotein beta subunit
LTYAVDIEITEDKVRVQQILGEYHRILEAPMPVLITVERQINKPRVAPMDKVIEAYDKSIGLLRAEDLNGDNEQFGLRGSPTKLKKVYTPKVLKGKVAMISGKPEDIARELVSKLREKCVI